MAESAPARRVRFDRNEFSGAFGDLGTDFPLLVGMIPAAGLDAGAVLTAFGLMQILTGLLYGLPMPVQPLKAMAVIVITQRISAPVLYGGGLAIGLAMLLLAVTGLVDALARVVPKVVVRGIQFGLGLQLATLALREYAGAEGWAGYGLALAAFALTVGLLGNRRFPPAPWVILLGVLYALLVRWEAGWPAGGAGWRWPSLHWPSVQDVATGFLVLALAQWPLSLGNSILATRQLAADLFPERPVSVRKISLTYALMNLLHPLLGGVPTCHGSGGMAGHYAFGGRTGGSVVIYGSMYLLLGLLLSGAFRTVVLLFPKPVLGVILLFEALALLTPARDTAASKGEFSLMLLVGFLAAGLPYGYGIALAAGTALAWLARRGRTAFGR